MSSTQQVWEFPAIHAAAEDIHGAAGAVQGLLEEGNGSLTRLVAAWEGDAAATYQQLQTKWNTASDELNAALQNLALTISEAASQMQLTEMTVKGTFGG